MINDPIPRVRRKNCTDYGEMGRSPGRNIAIRLMGTAEHFLRLLSLMAMTGAACICLTLYLVVPTRAQGIQQQINTLQTAQIQNADHVAEGTRRIDELTIRLTAAELRLTNSDSSLARVYGFGGGLGAILAFLQVFQILGALKK
jgi:hypothetical protein